MAPLKPSCRHSPPPRANVCRGSMVEGLVIDNRCGTRASSWVDGAPDKSIWVGRRLLGKKPIEIKTFRCNRRGFLESYAPLP